MVTITLKEEEVLQLEVMVMDGDKEAALAFLRERLLPEVKRQKTGMIRNHLDAGRGSAQ